MTKMFPILLLLSSCAGVIPVVPTGGNDPNQAWAKEERAAHQRFVRWHHEQMCDPLSWPNTAKSPSQHPECER